MRTDIVRVYEYLNNVTEYIDSVEWLDNITWQKRGMQFGPYYVLLLLLFFLSLLRWT